MYELIQVSERNYYIQSPAKIGLIRLNDHDVCLIDSGNDKDAGRKVRQILDANKWHLTAIYNTHSNADHIGGNQYLQKQDAGSTRPGSNAILPGTLSWSPPSCTEAFRSRNCATNFSWRSRAARRS